MLFERFVVNFFPEEEGGYTFIAAQICVKHYARHNLHVCVHTQLCIYLDVNMCTYIPVCESMCLICVSMSLITPGTALPIPPSGLKSDRWVGKVSLTRDE